MKEIGREREKWEKVWHLINLFPADFTFRPPDFQCDTSAILQRSSTPPILCGNPWIVVGVGIHIIHSNRNEKKSNYRCHPTWLFAVIVAEKRKKIYLSEHDLIYPYGKSFHLKNWLKKYITFYGECVNMFNVRRLYNELNHFFRLVFVLSCITLNVLAGEGQRGSERRRLMRLRWRKSCFSFNSYSASIRVLLLHYIQALTRASNAHWYILTCMQKSMETLTD